jgi:hypothetical protein
VPASYLLLRNVVKSYDGKSNAVDDLIRPERLRPCGNGGAELFAKIVDLTIEGTVNYGDSVLLIGKAGTIPVTRTCVECTVRLAARVLDLAGRLVPGGHAYHCERQVTLNVSRASSISAAFDILPILVVCPHTGCSPRQR